MSESSIATEVLSASVGGAISAGLLYPLEVLKTKMQAVDTTTTTTRTASQKEDDKDMDDDDDGHQILAGSDIHDEEEPYEAVAVHRDPMTPKLKDGATTVVPPQQISMIQFAKDLYHREGWIVFVRGLEFSAFQSALEKALYFFAYTALKEIYTLITNGARLGTLTNLMLGCAAEWAHLPISLPIDAWTTKIKTSNEAPLKILLTMLSDKNQNFYKGISAYYLLCFKPALQYTLYEQVKAVVLIRRTKKALSTVEAFLLGMVARTIATMAVFPFLRAKVLAQTAKTADSHAKSTDQSAGCRKTTGTMDILRQQWKQGGLASLYLGLGPELTRGILSAGLSLAIKERIPSIIEAMLQSRYLDQHGRPSHLQRHSF